MEKNRMKKHLLLLAITTGIALGQNRMTDTTPGLVPATTTDVATSTVRVYQITLTETSGSNTTCTIKDKQSTPREIFSGTVNASSLYVIPFPNGRLSPGGLTWSCSSGTAVVGAITYQQ
jgi:hypothetical protein